MNVHINSSHHEDSEGRVVNKGMREYLIRERFTNLQDDQIREEYCLYLGDKRNYDFRRLYVSLMKDEFVMKLQGDAMVLNGVDTLLQLELHVTDSDLIKQVSDILPSITDNFKSDSPLKDTVKLLKGIKLYQWLDYEITTLKLRYQ